MTPSQSCFELIKRFEGCRLTAYADATGIPTIGWGSTGRDIHLGMTWTQPQADQRMEQDVDRFGASVSNIIGTTATTQSQFDALTDFAYNLGAHALAGSTLMMLHKMGNYAEAAEQFQRWDRAGYVVLQGLLNRRLAEAELYRGE